MGWAQLIGQGIQGASQIAQGKQAAADAETNRRIAEFQAQDALLRGTKDEERYRRLIATTIGAQRAEFGARNVTTSGTALDILSDTAQVGGEDIAMIRSNAARTAWGYRAQANEASRWGQAAQANAYGQAGSTLLTAGANAWGQWKKGQ